jgi:hypothetical protein
MLNAIALPLAALSLLMALEMQAPAGSTGTPPPEVILRQGETPTRLIGVKPATGSRTFRILILGFSRDLLLIGGAKAATRVTARTPAFLLTVPAGVEPDEAVVLARLTPKDGRREVGRDRNTTLEIEGGDIVAMTFEPAEPGTPAASRLFKAAPKAPLKPGEYAIVFQSLFYAFGVD